MSDDTRRDRASIDDLVGALRAVMPGLERFVRFEGLDPARLRSRWLAALDGPLPLDGIGRDAVLDELSLGVLGLGRNSLCEIALDGAGTIDVDALQRRLDLDARAGRSQVAIVACAGDVNTGCSDDEVDSKPR
jgi:hypothetical protein